MIKKKYQENSIKVFYYIYIYIYIFLVTIRWEYSSVTVFKYEKSRSLYGLTK